MAIDITKLDGDDLWTALTSGQKVEVTKPTKPKAKKPNGTPKPTKTQREIRLDRWAEPDTTQLRTGTWEAIEITMFVIDFTCKSCGHTCLQPAYPSGANVMLKMRHTHNKSLTRYVPAYAFGPDTSRLPSRRLIQKRTAGTCPHCFNPSEADSHDPDTQ